ncbi:hypothetical protein [Massilia antarctica]|uniref:hypothetical protein n=1 Tax=Massilia antarctica TaxID=2765360 RepID=UPI0006BDBCD8|nr:hypothetical protein [Massilia sp. H27-R4]MCY0914879.1 hypothetical protein [Massilia sp. H27-R4]CUI08074.1 hypothetical protein BN2497_10925 [Janthinobacterium sp. CG23_2]CUU31860.1 hypothetical protein BN3177_10925 [Janthinobacterium sp. CG23_2]
MKSLSFIAAVAVFLAGSAVAADAPVANASVSAAASSITATRLNVPELHAPSTRTRAEVRAETLEAAKTARPTLSNQLDISKN